MNRKLIFLVILPLALFFAALLLRRGEIASLALPFLIYLFMGILGAPSGGAIQVKRSIISKTAGSHGNFIQTLTVKNNGPAEVLLEIQDAIFPSMTLIEGNLEQSLCLSAGEEIDFTTEFTAKRGIYAWKSLLINSFDPLQITEEHLILPAISQIMIKPETIKLRHLPLHPRKTLHLTGNIPARLAGSGTDIWGVREYQLGDQLQRLNWRKIARNPHHLYTNEFEQEEITDIGLIVDARMLGNPSAVEEALLEYAIQAAASLAESFLREGNRVGLLVFGKRIMHLFPGYGKVQLNKVLWNLALTELRTFVSLNQLQYLPFRLFPAQTQLIMVSPFAEPDYSGYTYLRANGYPLLLLSPDPVDFWNKSQSVQSNQQTIFRTAQLDRQLQLKKITRIGVQVIDWQVDQPLNAVLQTALTRSTKYSNLGRQ